MKGMHQKQGQIGENMIKNLFKKKPKQAPPQLIEPLIRGHIGSKQKLKELEDKLGVKVQKMLVEEYGDVHKFLTMIRLEHKAMKKLLVKKCIVNEKEIQKEAEKISGRSGRLS